MMFPNSAFEQADNLQGFCAFLLDLHLYKPIILTMTSTHLIMSLLLLFYGCAENTFTQPPPSTLQFGKDETLDIITWNIEEFPKSYLTVEYLSQVIIELDADIVALQEIESQSE
ncbi:MAG: hypothetical protein HOA66_04535, partial [Candidatus Marinimicrobia bacterium]|nr:hypothetical protein [Candidatus Neomarinimicrobiota bacterium]